MSKQKNNLKFDKSLSPVKRVRGVRFDELNSLLIRKTAKILDKARFAGAPNIWGLTGQNKVDRW